MLVSCFNFGEFREATLAVTRPRVGRANTQTAAVRTFEIASKVISGQVSRANRMFLGVSSRGVIGRTYRVEEGEWLRVVAG